MQRVKAVCLTLYLNEFLYSWIYFLHLQEGEEFLEREAKRAKTDEEGEGEKKEDAEEAKAED